jgi:membrane fusion protein (multidrug efflux system)
LVKLAIVLAAIGALVGVGLGVSSNKRETPPSEAAPVKVTVMPVAAEPTFADTFELPAVVEPNRVVEISAEVDGRVEWIGPEKGAAVRTGDPLVRLNTELLEAQFQMAQAQAKNSQTEFERIKGLVEKGAAPSRDLDAAATQLAINTAQLAQARVRLARASITAPMAGVLNNIPVEEGEYITAAPPTTVAEIVDISVVKVVTEVPERDVPFLSVGEKAEVLADVKGRRLTRTGTITFISRLADPRTRSTRLEITLANPENLLHSGQIVQARLTRQVLHDVILVPLLAVIPLEEGKSVYVVQTPAGAEAEGSRRDGANGKTLGKAERREVELGIIKGDRVQITSGLQPGDQLIVAGHRFVAPGQDVEIIPESK